MTGSPPEGPRNLWEAAGALAQIQEQQGLAIRAGDIPRLNRLLSEQAVAWDRVRGCAEQLIARGEAPEGMVERLRESLRIHQDRERELEIAKDRLAARLAAAQQAQQEERPARKAA
jgi:hypothetical protein